MKYKIFTLALIFNSFLCGYTSFDNSNNTNEKPVSIIFLPSYGNDKEVSIRGIAVRDDISYESNAYDSWCKNMLRNIGLFYLHPIKDTRIHLFFNGKTIRSKTDKQGFFEIKAQDFGKVTFGINQVNGQVQGILKKTLQKNTTGLITIKPINDKTIGVVSDIDDTIQKSYITNKFKALGTILFKNNKTQEKIIGVPELYNSLDKNNDGNINGDIYYLSGSPTQLIERIKGFLSNNNFPLGSIDLKRIGKDNLFQQMDYKLSKLRPLFNTYPDKKFILFGDNGEKDPEIYKQISKEFPNRVIAIYINNVTNDDKNSSRYEGIILTNNTSESADDLKNKGLITQEDLRMIYLIKDKIN